MNDRYDYGDIEKVRLFLKRGQKVKSNVDIPGVVFEGEILEFLNHNHFANGYTLKNIYGKRLILQDDVMFSTLPSKETIKELIDMALSLNDKDWFDELVYIFKYGTEHSK